MAHAGRGVDLKNQEEVGEYLDNLFVEYKFGCHEEHHANACHLLGEYLQAVKRNHKMAFETFKKNCDESDYAESCSKVASYLVFGGICERSRKSALAYFEKSCDLGFYDACRSAGIMLSELEETVDTEYRWYVPPHDRVGLDYARSIDLFRKACDKGSDSMSCAQLGVLYECGLPGCTKNLELAHKYASRACSLVSAAGCALLHKFYSQGIGCEVDQKRADYYDRLAKRYSSNAVK